MISVCIRTLIVYVTISLSLRILGKRQIGELDITELVSTLLLSELAAISVSDPDVPLFFSLIPIFLIVAFELLISDIKNRLPILKKIFEGSPSVLIRQGKLDQGELRRMRISLEELTSAFRLQGVTAIEDVYYAILEQNGQLSVILKKEKQPPDASLLRLSVKEEGISHAVLVDGQIKKEELSACGHTEAWLRSLCRQKGLDPTEIFLLTVNDGGTVHIIPKERKKGDNP